MAHNRGSSASISRMKCTLEDVDGRLGANCKTLIGGSNPPVASITLPFASCCVSRHAHLASLRAWAVSAYAAFRRAERPRPKCPAV